MNQASPEQVRAWIAQSIRRSPGEDREIEESEVQQMLARVGAAIQDGRAHLWVGAASAVVTEPLNGVRVWQAGGDFADMVAQMTRAADILRAQGFERMTIEETRKGWAKVLRQYNFQPFQGLELEL
ncbi:MAG: hypothetical protein KDA53_12710 [Hyphomonas sp.]|nr:hypothetical protein [Hyphomonas sp.]